MSETPEHIEIIVTAHDNASKDLKKIERSVDDLGESSHDTGEEIQFLTEEQYKQTEASKKSRAETDKYNKSIKDAEKATADYLKIMREQNRAKAEETRAIDAATRASRQETHDKEKSLRVKAAEAKMIEARAKARAQEIKAVEAAIKGIEAENRTLDAETRRLKENNTTRREAIVIRKNELSEIALHLRGVEAEQRADMNVTNAQNALTRARKVDLDVIKEQRIQTDRLTREENKRSAMLKKTGRDLNIFQKIARGVGSTISAIFTPRMLLSLFKFGSVFALVGQLIGGITALGAAAYSAVAGLTPLLGNLIALPGFLAAGVQGMAAMVIGMRGVGGAMKALSAQSMLPSSATPEERAAEAEAVAAAMAKLAPNAKEFVTEFAKFREPLHELQQMVQDKLFANMGETFKQLAQDYIPLFYRGLGLTADALNRVFVYWKDIFLRPETMNMMANLMETNAMLVENLGKGLSEWAVGFLHVIDIAGPTLKQMGADFEQAGKNFNSWVTDNPTMIADFFEKAYGLLKDTNQVIKDLSVGLYNVGRAAGVMSRDLGHGMEDIAKNFRDWTGSTEGQDRMKSFFRTMIPIVDAIGGILRGIGTAFITISETPGIAGAFENMGKLVDPLTRLVTQTLTGGFIDSLIKIIDALAEFGASGWAQIVAQAFSTVADAINIMAGALAALPSDAKDMLGMLLGGAIAFKFGKGVAGRLIPGVGKGGATAGARAAGGGGASLLAKGAGILGIGGAAAVAARRAGKPAGAAGRHAIKPAAPPVARNLASTGAHAAAKPVGSKLSFLTPYNQIEYLDLAELMTPKEFAEFQRLQSAKYASPLSKNIKSNEDIAFQLSPAERLAERNWKPTGPSKRISAPAVKKDLRGDAWELAHARRTGAADSTTFKNRAMNSEMAGGGNAAWVRMQTSLAAIDHSPEAIARSVKAVGERINGKAMELDMQTRNAISSSTWQQAQDNNKKILGESIPAAVAHKMLDMEHGIMFDADDSGKERVKTAAQRVIDAVANKLEALDDPVAAATAPGAAAALAAATRIFNLIASRLGSLAQQIQYRATYGISQGGPLEKLFTGGSVAKGSTALVGEKGPEAFLGANGTIGIVGAHGPQLLKFGTAGAIVNNEATLNPWTSKTGKTPGWALQALQGAYTGLAASLEGVDPFAVGGRYAEGSTTPSNAYGTQQNSAQTLALLSSSVASLANAVSTQQARGGRQVSDTRSGQLSKNVMNVYGQGQVSKGQVQSWMRQQQLDLERRRERR